MGFWASIGPIFQVANTILSKYIPGYKDKPKVERRKHLKEAKKWDEASDERQQERFARSLSRSLGKDVPKK